MESKRSVAPRRYRRRTFRKRPYMARPQKSLYDADAFIKVQRTVPIVLLTAINVNVAQIQMRSDLLASGAVDFTYLDQQEYLPFTFLYNLVELRGMKMEVTMGNYQATNNRTIHAARIYAGPSSGVPVNAAISEAPAAGLPVQVQCNLQGQVSSCYYNVHQELKRTGMPSSVNRIVPYPADYGFTVFVCVATEGFSNNDHVG